jgi:hypothetical protein
MTDIVELSPREKIDAAIARLEQLKADAGTYSEWLGGDFQHVRFGVQPDATATMLGGLTVDVWDGSEQFGNGDWRDSSAVTLIRVLHAALLPQLSLLRSVQDGFRSFPGNVWAVERNNAVAIADAILSIG